jgi:Na+/H+ antiporter
MGNFEILIIIIAILVALLAIAEHFRLTQSVLLVLSGLAIGFIPSIPQVTLNPEVVFFIFLPPILFDASSHMSWRDFRMEIKPISTLAIALVFFTTITVAITTHLLIPGFPWAFAFVLGAIVSPPDAVAATSITKGLGLNRRVVTILEGESLVNDASALIAYRMAIAAIGTGAFVMWDAALNFSFIVLGGIVVGLLTGYIFMTILKKVADNSIIATSLTLLVPFLVYLAAERLHTSGVLAVVTVGLMMSWRASEVYSYQTRIRNKAVWDTLIFLLNGFIFILIGLQFPLTLNDLETYSVGQLTIYALAVSIVTILVRILWVFAAAFSPFASSGKKRSIDTQSNTWKNVMIVAWTGTRGVVSLATALALPLTVDSAPFPHRSLILFLAFTVIFATLVVQGLSLPLLVKVLGVKNLSDPDQEEHALRLLMANNVIRFIEEEFPYEITTELKQRLKDRYIVLIDALAKNGNEQHALAQRLPKISEFSSAQLEVQKFERTLLAQLHKDGTFNQSVIRRIEQELDTTKLQFDRAHKRKKR